MSNSLRPHGLYAVHGNLQARILGWVTIPFPGDLPNPGIEPGSSAFQADSLVAEPSGKPYIYIWLGQVLLAAHRSLVAVHRLSCPKACGILVSRSGIEPYCKVDSLPLDQSPCWIFLTICWCQNDPSHHFNEEFFLFSVKEIACMLSPSIVSDFSWPHGL